MTWEDARRSQEEARAAEILRRRNQHVAQALRCQCNDIDPMWIPFGCRNCGWATLYRSN